MKRLLPFLLLFFCWISSAEAANRFLTCSVTCTITASDTTIWGTTTGGTGASVPGSSDAVILDGATCVGGVTCTATMGAGYNPTWQSITMGACTASTTGCIFDWSVNNNSVTLTSNAAFSGTGTGTRTLKMGSGTWTLNSTANSNLWNMTATTNLTLNAGSSTVLINGVSASNPRTFIGGGLTYSTLQITATGSGFVHITGANTFSNLTATAPVALQLAAPATTQTVTTLALNGTSANQVYLFTDTPDSVATLSVASNAPTMTWVGLRDITGTGGATFAATNSFDLGHNTGITITVPSTTGGGGRIIGGWLLPRYLYPTNDNDLMWLEKAA